MKRAAVVYLIFVLFPFALTLHAQAQAPAHGGEVKTESPSTSISVTVMLSLHALDDAEALMKSLTTPGDPQFHKFLTADQFVARFAPKDAEVAKVVAELSKYGLAAQRTTATTLNVTGQPFDMERAFSVSLHTYEVPAHGNVPGYTYHVPLSPPTIPAEISEMVSAVVGLDSGPSLHTNHHVAHNRLARASAAQGSTSGNWTVLDFANYYDVQLLYKLGLSGKGRTLGIVTLASFTPSDAFAYWSALGLSVDPNRIQIVNIDGGPGAPSDASDSIETTLDVEQSGGIAPGANIIVYQAPNTEKGFADAFAAAVETNSAETLSTSWGKWEWLFGNNSVQTFHELFLRAAIQGQTVFAASGDYGPYDVDAYPPCFSSSTCFLTFSVNYPASDPAITAAGGTTLAGNQKLCLNAACTPPYYTIDILHEGVWGWDYLLGLCDAIGQDPITCGIFPLGSGGGVSTLFEVPSYQLSLPGIQLSQPDQNVVFNEKKYMLPSNFPGRNLPDVSFNADPDTGYAIYYTSDVSGFGIKTFWGGTSFVAPQLNGVSALFGEYLQSRLGLLNDPFYRLALSGQAYTNPGAPLRAIPYGDNWFYQGNNGYSLGAGLGTLDVANFAEFLRKQ